MVLVSFESVFFSISSVFKMSLIPHDYLYLSCRIVVARGRETHASTSSHSTESPRVLEESQLGLRQYRYGTTVFNILTAGNQGLS